MGEESGHRNHEEHHHHHEHEHHVRLIIQTLSGNYSHEFNKDDRLEHVVKATLEHLHIVSTPGEIWELRHHDHLLNLEHTIEQAHLKNDAVLKLAPKESGGGASRGH
jgi:hypothetical protein